MKRYQQLTAIAGGLALLLSAGFAQADKVKFYIGYSNYDHGYQSHHYQRYSYSYGHPARHIIQYNYHPYYGIKYDKKQRRKHKHHANCHHADYYAGHKKHKHQYGYDKRRREHKRHDDYRTGWSRHNRDWHY